jgi:hypothetical protein
MLAVAVVALAVPARAAETDKLLPNSTNAVISMNVRQLLDSALIKKFDDQIKAGLNKNGEAKKILEALGFDPFKDVDRVVVAGSGDKPEEALILVLGKFNREKLEAAAEQAAKDDKSGLTIHKEGNYKLYEIHDKNQNKPAFGAILSGTVIALAPNKDMVVDALDRQSGKKKSDLKKDLLDLLGKADLKQSISITALAQGLGGGQAQDFADKIKAITGGINVTDDIKLNIDLASKDADSAKDVAKVMDDGLGQAKAFIGLMAAQDKKWEAASDILGTVKVNAVGSNVNLKGEISKTVIDKLLKLIPKQ